MSTPASNLSSSTTAPSHGHPSKTSDTDTQPSQTNTNPSTSDHPAPSKPDPTVNDGAAAKGGLTTSPPTSSAEFTNLKVKLRSALRQYPDFPTPGVLFEDIMPLFTSPELHEDLIRALHTLVTRQITTKPIDVVVGLESRGFLFGPTLALRLGAAFVPVRKKGKLPGTCETESFEKEYGADHFQMQSDAIKAGQRVVIVDDIIATGGSAAAAGKLVRKLGGDLLAYVFMMELDFLKGRDKLDAPVHTLFAGQEEALASSK